MTIGLDKGLRTEPCTLEELEFAYLFWNNFSLNLYYILHQGFVIIECLQGLNWENKVLK